MKDEHVIGLVGGGVGLYLLYRWKEGEGDSFLPDFGSLFAGVGGGLPALDLSNLIGGINLGELLGGIAPDANAVEEYLRGCLSGGAVSLGGGEPVAEKPAPEQGREPTLPDFPFPEPTGFVPEATGFVQEVGKTSPWFQAGLGALFGAAGIGAGAMMVKTSPAMGQAASALVRGGSRVASSAWSQLSRQAALKASRKAAQQAAQRAATSTAAKWGAQYVLPAPAKGWLGRTLGVGGALAALPFAFGTLATEFGRLLYGEQAPEKVVGWGLLDLFSPGEWVREARGGVRAAPARMGNLAIGSGAEYGAVMAGRRAITAGIGSGSEYTAVMASRARAQAAVGTGAEFAQVVAGRDKWKEEKRQSSSKTAPVTGFEPSFTAPGSLV